MSKTQEQPPISESRRETILIIEHDLGYGLFLVGALLQKTSYEVFVATERFQALDFLKYLKPILLIVDYQLPGMNGIELYDHFQGIEQFKALPVLILTTGLPHEQEEIRQRQLHSLRKPVQLQELFDYIEQLEG